MASQEIAIAGGKRTPFGDFGRSLKDIPLSDLATHAAKACIEEAGLDPLKIDHAVWGNVLPVDPDGYYVGRVAALNAGMPETSCALAVNRACGSGTQAILTAAQQIMTGQSTIAIAGAISISSTVQPASASLVAASSTALTTAAVVFRPSGRVQNTAFRSTSGPWAGAGVHHGSRTSRAAMAARETRRSATVRAIGPETAVSCGPIGRSGSDAL